MNNDEHADTTPNIEVDLPEPPLLGIIPPDTLQTLPSQSVIDRLMQIANTLASSTMPMPTGCHTAGGIFRILLTGHEHGMCCMAALDEIYVVHGRTTMNARTKVAMVRKHGLGEIDVIETTPEKAVVNVRRADWPPERQEQITFTLEEAKTASLLTKDNWRHWPADMLVARATGRACNIHFQELFVGLGYTPDELGEETDREGRPIATPANGRTAPWAKQDVPTTDTSRPVLDALHTGFEQASAQRTAAQQLATSTATTPTPQAEQGDDLDAPMPGITPAVLGARPTVKPKTTPPSDAAPLAAPVVTPDTAPDTAPDLPAPPRADASEGRIRQLVGVLKMTAAQWKTSLANHFGGATKLSELSPVAREQASMWLARLADIKQMRADVGYTDATWAIVLKNKGVSNEFALHPDQVSEIWRKLVYRITPFRRKALGIALPEDTTDAGKAPAPTGIVPPGTESDQPGTSSESLPNGPASK